MTRNNAGGFAFKADSWTRFERFILLGAESGSYYVSESDLTSQNVDNVRACIVADGIRAVDMIRNISVAGRAPKNDPAIYALALAASYGGDVNTRALALAALPAVCRIGTHLFTFAEFIDSMRGWGTALRRAVAAWYLEKKPDQLAFQLVKYQQRNGWSHKDLLRLAHVEANTAATRWALGKSTDARFAKRHDAKKKFYRQDIYPHVSDNWPGIIEGFEEAKGTKDEKVIIKLIADYGLTREMIPTEFQKSPAVWEALLDKMPPTAMIRTLGRMGASGLLAPLSDASKKVVAALGDREKLRKARVHPIQVLSALLTYKQGKGQKGSLTWTPVPTVVDALDGAFYKAFELVEPTGKSFYMGVDVSGSMAHGTVAGIAGLTPNMGAAAMSMLIARTEPNYFIGGFATQFVSLGISKSDRLDAAMKKAQRSFGGTDCAVAVNHAFANKVPVDAFVVITDGETWAGGIHNSQALEDYRQKMGINAKLVVINMIANKTSIADPEDGGSLDVVGFDASVPTLINGFIGANSAGTGPESESESE